MRRSTVMRFVTMASCALLLLGCAALVSASSAPVTPNFTVSLNKRIVTLSNGKSTPVTVRVSAVGAFHASVAVSITGLPAGVSAVITPTHVTPTGTATLTLTASNSVTTGSYALTVTGTSGALSHSAPLRLIVSAPAAFAMTVTPSSRTVIDGAAVDYTITVTRRTATGVVNLSVSGLPANVTAAMPARITPPATTATLHLVTTTNAVPGSYPITVAGTAALAKQTATATLVIVPQTFANFPITGTLDRVLYMGTTARINLAMTDPFTSPLTVTGLSVAVTATSNPSCTTSNFAVTQYSGSYPLTVPAKSTKTLSQLGIATSAWPTVTLTDLPVNQDACKHVTLTFTYGGSGSGN